MKNKKIFVILLILFLKTISEEHSLGRSRTIEPDTICIPTPQARALYKKQQLFDLEFQRNVLNKVQIITLKDTVISKNKTISITRGVLTSRDSIILLQSQRILIDQGIFKETKEQLSSARHKITIFFVVVGILLTFLATHFLGTMSLPNLLLSFFKKTNK